MQSPPPKFSGLLTKRGHIIKNWKLRYFVLEKGKLGYFKDGDPSTSLENHHGRTLQGTFPLENVICGGRTANDPLKLYLVDLTTEKELYMRASNPHEAAVWEENIKLHAEYAKITCLSPPTAVKRRQSTVSTNTGALSTDSAMSVADDDASRTACNESGSLLQFELIEEKLDDKECLVQIDSIEQDINLAMSMDSSASDQLTSSLGEIAKEIKRLEGVCKKDKENALREFNKTTVPMYKVTVKDLDLRIAALKKRIKTEYARGEEHLKSLEEEVDGFTAQQDQIKCKMYFPSHLFSMGSGGVYFAFDDIWLEQLSGRFNIQLLPSVAPESSQIIVLLSGVSGDHTTDGVTARLLIDNFKLKGDTGKGVPPLAFEHLVLSVTFNVTLVLTYNQETKAWSSPSDQFRVNIVTFKGPFGINRSVVSSVLSLAIPIMKHLLLKIIPSEVGMLLRTLPTHIKVAGDFSISGAHRTSCLMGLLHTSSALCSVLGMTPDQLKLFVLLQKRMQRGGMLSSILNLVEYKRAFDRHELWDHIVGLWERAAAVYFNGISSSGTDCSSADASNVCTGVLSFKKLMLGVEQVLKNPLHVSVHLTKLEGGIGLLSLNRYTRSFLERYMDEATRGRKKLSDAQLASLSKIFDMLNLGTDAVEMVARSLDYLSLSLGVKVAGGPSGYVRLLLQAIDTQAQMAIWTSLPKAMNMGMDYVVPMMMNMETRKSGVMDIRLYHLGSTDMLEAIKFADFMKNKSAGIPVVDSLKKDARIGTHHPAASQELKRADRASTGDMAALELLQKLDYEDYTESVGRINRDVEHLLDQSPCSQEAHEMFRARVVRPRVLFVVDGTESVDLQPGAPLFILQVGPTHAASEAASVVNMEHDFMASLTPEEDEPCSLTVQTASKIRVQAQVPDIRVQIPLPALLRFVNNHFKDYDRLSRYMATFILQPREDIAKHLPLLHQFVMFITKQLLVPDALELSVNLAVDVRSSIKEGLEVWIKPPEDAAPAGGGNSEGVAGEKNSDDENLSDTAVVKLTAIIQIGDIVRDLQDLAQTFMDMQAGSTGNSIPITRKSSAENADCISPSIQYTVRITCIRCLNLLNVESILGGRKNDPYVIMRVGASSFRTTEKKDAGACCEWVLGKDVCVDDMTFSMTDCDLNPDGRTFDVEVNVFDWNKRTSHIRIGGGFDRVPVTDNVDLGTSFSFTIDLQTNKYLPAGVVEIQYDLTSTSF